MADTVTRGARGVAVTVIGQALMILIQLASVTVLARLLAPEDFGLVAMVTVFVTLGEMIRDFGMSMIGIQRRHLSQQEASNLFWLNTTLGVVSGVLLAASTGMLVLLYDEARLWWVVPAMAPTLILNGMAAQIRVQLSRSMRFRVIVLADVGSQAVIFGVTVALAILGFGYWSLVISRLIGSAFGLVVPWIATCWIPARPRRDGASKRLFKDGAAFGFAHFLTYLASNVDTMIIGMRWDPTTVGVYNRGYQLLSLPIQQLMGPLAQVVIPTVNRITDEEGRTVDSLLMRIQFGLGLVVIWVFSVSGATAAWLIPFVLGEAWHPVVPIFQALSFGGFFWSFSQANYWRVILENRGRALVKLNLVTKSLTIGLIVAGSFVSPTAVAWAVTAGLALTWPIALIWFGVSAKWDSWAQFANGMRLIVPGALGSIFGLEILRFQGVYPSVQSAMVVGIIVTTVYLIGILCVPGGFQELRAVFRLAKRMAPVKGHQSRLESRMKG